MRAAAAIVAVALVGCGLAIGEPAWVADRPRLASCGEVTLHDDEVMPADMRRCMLAALNAGQGAEQIVHHRDPTDGLPVDQWVRLLPDGSVELIQHLDPERNAEGSWELLRCGEVEVVDGMMTFVDCQMVETR